MASLFEKRKEKAMKETQNAAAVYDQPYLDELAEHYKARLLRDTNLEMLTRLSQGEMRLRIEQFVSQFMTEEKVVISRTDKEALLTRILDEAVGFGPLEPLIHDDSITEILINGPKQVYIERRGKLELTGVVFRDDSHVRHVIDRIVAPLGRRIDESSPMVDARLPDGSRVNAVIPPISLNGTIVSIRKFRKEPFQLEDLLALRSLSEDMGRFLTAIVKGKMNVLISGGTGSGKTTLLNVAAGAIPMGERVITIEDSAELRLERPNAVGMEARPANVEGRGEVTIRQLVRNALRMRPDRIIVGEVRGAEAFDMLQAMNTGHEGSLTTVHANSPADALRRVEAMVIMAGLDLPSHVIREYVVGALDFIVQATRLTDGTRKIISIAEVVKGEAGESRVQEIFTFKRTGLSKDGDVEGCFTATGIVPACLQQLQTYGTDVDESMFRQMEVKR
jgi:pilus assembly protein CpaF